MVGFGLGFGSRAMSRQYAALGQNVPVSALRPSSLWNGTAGSGFAGSPPVDPVRTTAKPVCRLLVPPNQYFTDELVIGVWAGANYQGSLLDNMGIDKVIAHCEGQSFEIVAPSFYLFEDANGNAVRYYGWWVVLQHPGSHGHAQVYFEAVPKDTSMQPRVIGPYQFSPQAVLHDYDLEVAATPNEIAGSRYKSLTAALNFLTAAGAQNPRVTITEGFVGDLGSANLYAGGAGYTTITATAPVVFKKPSLLPGAASLFRPRVDGLWFRGPNITFDFYLGGHIYHEAAANRAHVFDGINFIDSGGRYYLVRLGQKGTTYVARDAPWLLECTIDGIQNAANGATLVRGCLLENGNSDAASSAACVIGSTFRNWTSEEWRAEIPALTVQYSGAGASATLELVGGNEAGSRTFNAKVAGSSVGTFAVVNSETGFANNTNYTIANVAAWLNGLPGWSANVLDNTRRATSLGRAATSGAAFAATDVKSAPLTLVTMFDQHADLWSLAAESNENMIFANNLCYNNSVQSLYIGPPAGLQDAVVVNNDFDLDEGDLNFGSFVNQLAYAQSHVVVAHNSSSNQLIIMRRDTGYDPDGYCLIANNIAPSLTWQGSGTDSDVTLRDNHLFAGASVPAGAIGTTIGGTKATLFLNPASGDFNLQGALLGILKTPSFRHDRNGAARTVPSVLGAMVGPGDVAPAITSGNPSGTYPENLPVSGTLAANKLVTWSVTGADANTVTIDPVSGGWSLQTTDFETKTNYAFTFVATDSASDTAIQAVAILVSDLDEIAPTLSVPQAAAVGTSGANLSVNTNEGNGTLYWYVSTSALPPSVATLMAGTGAVAGGSQAIAAAGNTTASVSGLAAGTAYYAYFLHRDGAGNNSAIASGSSFTTNVASGGSVSVISSAVVLKTSDLVGSFVAAPFTFAGGTERVLVAVVTLCQQATQLSTDVTLSVNGTAMVRLAGSAHSLGSSRPICAVFVATGQAAGSKTISVNVAGNARSCSVLAMEVAGLNTTNLLANSVALEGSTLTYSHSYTPTAAGNLILSALATRQGDRGPFAPDAAVTELQDDSTGATATSDHSAFVGYAIAGGTTAVNVGATIASSTDALFLVTELRKA